ncbi:GTP cyclohydrolase I [Paenarthrobacter sp. Z7-10]|uniref:GTP cyclohydrolase I n=1 Tax=Paenarthrobacter sp. Z7-10 TaxID=2787635 RepID=UPI0022A9B260|nr:GTP cyclohydrolase I [Paenarthrobacter sp. Z7-10]MCZ2402753.1 GTP cyclohydrolase I [Paenarthrobacter sp. Z7-10]
MSIQSQQTPGLLPSFDPEAIDADAADLAASDDLEREFPETGLEDLQLFTQGRRSAAASDRIGPDRIGPDKAPTAAAIDAVAAERAIRDFLHALGRDTNDPHLLDTPRRVVGAFTEMLTPRPTTWTTFPNDEGYHDLVLVKNVPFHSLCQHHLLPFRGVAHLGYLPGDRLFGLSKLARGLEHFARDLQVQERLTQQLADWLVQTLNPRGVGVVLEAEHTCMSLRGVLSSGTITRTSTFDGELSTSGPLRSQFPN